MGGRACKSAAVASCAVILITSHATHDRADEQFRSVGTPTAHFVVAKNR